MTQGPFIKCQLWKMAKDQKREMSITRLVTSCHKFPILSFRSISVWWQFLSNSLQECHSSIKSQNPRWLPILPYDFCHKTVTLELSTNNIWYCLNKPNKQFVTPVRVFGWWQLIMLTMKCYGYKILSRVIFTIVGRGRWWNVPNKNFYNSTTRHLLQQVCPQQKMKDCIAACYETWS